MLFDVIFSFPVMYVHNLNYIFVAINMFTWKQKETVVFDIVFHRIVISDVDNSLQVTHVT